MAIGIVEQLLTDCINDRGMDVEMIDHILSCNPELKSLEMAGKYHDLLVFLCLPTANSKQSRTINKRLVLIELWITQNKETTKHDSDR